MSLQSFNFVLKDMFKVWSSKDVHFEIVNEFALHKIIFDNIYSLKTLGELKRQLNVENIQDVVRSGNLLLHIKSISSGKTYNYCLN